MSYQIDNVEIIHENDFSITLDALKTLGKTLDNIPECSIFDHDWPEQNEIRNGKVYPKKCFWWSGEGSGYSDETLKKALAAFDGEADLVLIWARGDSFTGLRLQNHVVTEHKVNMTLE